jgi:hypothetical protein
MTPEWMKKLAADPRFVKAEESGVAFIILGARPSVKANAKLISHLKEQAPSDSPKANVRPGKKS